MSDTRLTPEERRAFQDFYKQRISAAKATDDAGELAAARDLLQAVINEGLTPVGDGSISYIRRGGMDWTDPITTAAAQAAASGEKPGWSRSEKAGGKDMLQGLLVIILGLLAAGWWFWPESSAESIDQEAAAAVITPTPMIDRNGLPTPLPTLESALLADVAASAGVKTGLVTPRTLEINKISFIVQPVRVTAGDWPPPDEERIVSWVYGTVINYVLGLRATPGNKALLKSLQPGDELRLRMSTGAAYRFAYADAVRVSPHASEIFHQTRPGLALVLLEDEEDSLRVVLQASYIPESELGLDSQQLELKAALGQTVRLDDVVRVTALDSQLLARPDAPPGYVHLAVSYRIENISAFELATTSFKHHLEANQTNYPLTPLPHETNPFPAAPEILAARMAFSTTAVYAIPQTALVEGVAWEFSPGPDGARVRVTLPPYTGRLAPLVEVRTVALEDTHLLATFVISAALNNLEIGPGDISISGATLSPTGNFFPWRAPAGGGGEFLLLLIPGDSRRVTVSLLEHGFDFEF